MSKNYIIQKQLKLILSFFIILNTLSVKSQNLVPNPSFETFTACPTSLALLFLATSWANPSTATPDYINSCSSNNFVSAPNNSFGWQNPRTGNGMAQIVCSNYISSVGFVNYREYIQAQLISPLIAGQNYQINFYANLRNNAKYSSNGLGAYLSIVPLTSTNNRVLNVTPQVYSLSVISDTLNWVQISGNFLANGGEQYITIGNFLDSITTITSQNIGGSTNATLYCIDDVSVTPMLPLPIELLAFDAIPQGNQVKTSWSTASEINNNYFTLLRSKDAINFEKIGTIQGAGNSNNQLNYTFYDDTPLNGKSYYQLKQTDFDGKYAYSNIVAVNFNKSKNLFLYPNPSSTELFISYNGVGIFEIKIYNTLGQVVFSKRFNPSINNSIHKISTNNLPKGNYTLKLLDGNQIITKKFIKN